MPPGLAFPLPCPAKLTLPSLDTQRNHNPSDVNLPPRNLSFESLNNRLIQSLNGGHLRKAISTLDLMLQNGNHPDLPTYSLLLKTCIRSRNFELGRAVHAWLDRSKLELDSVTLNSLISLYTKCGDWEKANAIFESMGDKRNLVSWSAIVSCFANNDMESEAICAFINMLENGFYPNEYCFTPVIRACSDVDHFCVGKVVFGFVIKCGHFDSDMSVGCALIDMFAKGSSDVDIAYKLFEKMPERNAVAWTLMMTRFAQFDRAKEAINLFSDMILSGYEPDQFAFTSVMAASSNLGLLSYGKQLHSHIIRSGLALDHSICCCLVDMYAKCAADGSMDDSRKIFDYMANHNVMSWTALITGYVQSGGCNEEAIRLFREMLLDHVRPNHFTFSSVLKACANLSDMLTGKQVHALAVKLGLASVNCVGNSLIHMYAESGLMEDFQRIFYILSDKNLITYNTMVDAYAKNLNLEAAFYLFYEIEDMGFRATDFTFCSLLSGVASTGAIGKGEQVHARLLKSGFESNQCVANVLVSMYSRCGNIDAALQVFNEMEDRNVITWTSIIAGFSKHGNSAMAMAMFHEMLQAGIKPNEITYTAVLSACSHAGLVSEGWKHFNSMNLKHRIAPSMEHYACMVDMLGRSGFLMDAFDFIKSMPFEADALIWRTFLGACRTHGNRELGKRAAKMLHMQNPHDPAAYILLSNLYASAGQWEEVAKIRKNMKKRNLVKEAGSSWIEVGNKLYKFHVGDTSHPKAHEIYEEMNQLASKIKKLGYIPNTDCVLHDVEDEQKEQFLLHHSEKIAVAFGLINTSQSRPIRVFNNLRVCVDCHTAIKFISKATGREIVLRDSIRFHHIKGGSCSCNDYW